MRLPARLLHRKADSQKRDFGHVLVLAGSGRLSGAGVLCALSAMRSGAGLTTLGIPESLNLTLIRIKPKELMTLPLPEAGEISLSAAGFSKIRKFIKSVDVIAIGPGLGRHKSTQALVRLLSLTLFCCSNSFALW